MDLIFSIALSAHLGFKDDYNFIHPNIRLKYNTYIAGVYYNSLERPSFYIGEEYQLTDKLTLEAGAVTGYTDDLKPMVRLKYNDYFAMPGEENGETLLVIGREWTF